MWHQAQYRGDELLVLGYNPRNNDVMLVRLAALPMNEQSELRKIAGSRSGREAPYLIPILRKMEAPNGADWFSYLAKKMEQRNSPVFMLPIKEVQDSLDPDQKAIFKGYGKGRFNRQLQLEDLEREHSEDRFPDREFDGQMAASPAPVNPLETKIEALAETSRQTNALLNKLVDVLMAEKVAAKKPVAKTTRKPRAKPDLSKLGHNQGPPMDLNEGM
jgi:hypothetical protein